MLTRKKDFAIILAINATTGGTFLKWREKIAATVASERGPFIVEN